MGLTFKDDNFDQEVLKSDVPVLVDFYADWCGPCKVQGPIIEELAKLYEGKEIKIGKLDVDQSPTVPQRYGIQSIPTLIIFKDGQPAEQLIGLQDKKVLAQKIEAVMQ